jgi:hypothetical protein
VSRIDKDRLPRVLEQITGPQLFRVDIPGVAPANIFQDLNERDFPYLNGHVNVVGHQAECMETESEPSHRFFE